MTGKVKNIVLYLNSCFFWAQRQVCLSALFLMRSLRLEMSTFEKLEKQFGFVKKLRCNFFKMF